MIKKSAWNPGGKEKAVKKPKKKRAKLRFKIEELALVVIFAAIGVGTIFFGSYAVEKYEINKAARGIFSPNVLVLGVRGIDGNFDDTNVVDLTKEVMDFINTEGDVAVYQWLLSGKQLPSFAIAFKGDVPTNARIVYGRYFVESDFLGDNAACVLGQGVYFGNISTRDGMNYYSASSKTYEAVGAIGYPIISSANNIKLYGLNAYGAQLNELLPFFVDFTDESRTDALKEKFTALLTAHHVKVVEMEVPSSDFTVSGFFNMELLNLIMLIFACFCVVLSTVPLTLFWAERRKKRVAVQRMLGFSSAFTLWRMFGRLMILFHLGFLLSYGVYAVIAEIGYLNLKSFFSAEMAVAYLGALVFNILIAIVPFAQTMRVEPGDALRRE